MMARRPEWLHDIFVAGLPLMAGLLDLSIRYRYHWATGETVVFAKVLTGLALVPILLWLGYRTLVHESHLAQILGRSLIVSARLAVLWLFASAAFPSSNGPVAEWDRLSAAGRCAIVIIATVCGLVVWGDGTRRRMRTAMAVAAFLFVISGPVLAWIHADDRFWPDRLAAAKGVTSGSGETGATAFLLLDETSAKAGEVLAHALVGPGWTVRFKAIDTVADGTAKAVPQIFTGEDFHAARPCTSTAICSEAHVLDFGRVHASRSDVDVVGFFHPYCAMQGLRSCFVTGVSMPLFDAKRWECALDRIVFGRTTGTCEAARNAGWERQKADLLREFWAAPFWTRGGVIFAHLPIPHPPATRSTSRLVDDYRANLEEAAELLKTVARRLSKSGGAATIVVFSDHPLRSAMWCADVRYSAPDCATSSAPLWDDRVPVIVATLHREPLDLGGLGNNAGVFDLLQVTPAHFPATRTR